MQVLEADVCPKVSQATPDDLSSVLALLRRCELLETGVAEAFPYFVVARSDAATVGCAGLEVYADVGLLRSVAVEPSARRSGLGKALVRGVVAAAGELGLRDLFLLTTTAPEFFERVGFNRVPRGEVPATVAGSWEFRVGCPQNAQMMRLSLQEA
jgi:amino-acid N-acetyltransferase